jgi:hypothetical protein
MPYIRISGLKPDLGREPSLEIEILGFLHHHHEISDPKSIIMLYIENLGFWPDWGVCHMRR